MRGDDDGSGEFVCLDAVECGGEEVHLARVEHLIGAALVGDDAGVFEHIAVKAEDANERAVEGEVDGGLDHGAAQQAARIGRGVEGRSTEVAQKSGERRFGVGGVDDAIVVAGDGEDGCGIEPVGFEELIVVIVRFAKVVDKIAEVEEEGRHVGCVAFGEVGHHLVGDKRLGGRPFDAAGVSDGVEDDLSGLLNGCIDGRALRAVRLRQCKNGFDDCVGCLRNRLDDADADVFLVGDGFFEAGWIGRGSRLREDRVAVASSVGSVGRLLLPWGRHDRCLSERAVLIEHHRWRRLAYTRQVLRKMKRAEGPLVRRAHRRRGEGEVSRCAICTKAHLGRFGGDAGAPEVEPDLQIDSVWGWQPSLQAAAEDQPAGWMLSSSGSRTTLSCSLGSVREMTATTGSVVLGL